MDCLPQLFQIPKRVLAFLASALFLSACQSGHEMESLREYSSSFESITEFQNFFIVPLGAYASSQSLDSSLVFDGKYSHKAWIDSARDTFNDASEYLPHRAYPTVQFHRTKDGVFPTPCLIRFWVYVDMVLQERAGTDDWLSFATFTPDTSNQWTRTVLVNLAPSGFVHLMHVPLQGMQEWREQVQVPFPQKQWVRLDIYLDFAAAGGEAVVWQDGVKVSEASVEGGQGDLAQAHFGLYAAAAVPSGKIYNDALQISQVESRADAESRVADGHSK